MSGTLTWRIQRLLYLSRRARGSIALRGWAGTLRHLLQRRANMSGGHASEATIPTAAAPLVSPTSGRTIRRMLVIDSMAPDPTRDSGSVRACHMLHLLREDGWELDFLASDGFSGTADVVRLANMGVRYIQSSPLRWLRENGQQLEAVLLSRVSTATQYLGLIRRHAPQAKVIFDTVDLHYLREQRAARLRGSRQLSRHAERSRRREWQAITHSDVTLVVSTEEQAALARDLPGSRVELLSNIHEVHGRRQGFNERKGLLFIGGFGHPQIGRASCRERV